MFNLPIIYFTVHEKYKMSHGRECEFHRCHSNDLCLLHQPMVHAIMQGSLSSYVSGYFYNEFINSVMLLNGRVLLTTYKISKKFLM